MVSEIFSAIKSGAKTAAKNWPTTKGKLTSLLSDRHVLAGMNPLKHQLPMMGLVAGSTMAFGQGSPKDRILEAGKQLGVFALFGGFSNPGRAMMFQGAWALSKASPGITTGLIQGFRANLTASQSLSVPFSHSTLAMDQAISSMSYGMSRMGSMQSALGNQAAMYSARFCQR